MPGSIHVMQDLDLVRFATSCDFPTTSFSEAQVTMNMKNTSMIMNLVV
jgi:hypothetical protein